MIKIFFMTTLFLFSAYGIDLTPGLWEVNALFKKGDEYVNPMAEIKETLAKMPEKQRKMMMKMMSSKSVSFGLHGDELTTCFTKEMFSDDKLFNYGEKDSCKTDVKEKTKKKIVTDFTCKSGSKGTATWEIKNNKYYTGIINHEDKDGKKNEIKYNMKFINKDCGDVKPMKF